MKKKYEEHVAVVKHFFRTTSQDYLPVTYDIEVNDHSLSVISEESARYIYEQLGELLGAVAADSQ